MIGKFFILLMLFSTTQLFSQQIIFESDYSSLPFELKIENSGIYSIASFDIDNDNVSFSSFTKAGVFQYANNKYLIKAVTQKPGNDFISGIDAQSQLSKTSNSISSIKETIVLKKNYLNGKSVLSDNGGIITGNNGEEITVAVPNRNRLIIKTNLTQLNNEMIFKFPSNLACADLIGIDKVGNLFVEVEKYVSEIPLKVEREVYTISKEGSIISKLILPNIKYLYTLKDLQIDADGNLYHLLSFTDKVVIVKWNSLTIPTNETIKYPQKYNKSVHFNEYVTTDEAYCETPKNLKAITSGVSRTEALKIADSYVLHQYNCSSSNLAPSNITAPDGDLVRTPDWLIVGTNARIPYKWGGFNTLNQFDDGLLAGKYAGDINTAGVSSYAVGVDCSGFVSRCWQLSYHSSTSGMPSITKQYASWDDLKPGDAIHKIGHVRLFVERNLNGSLKVVESTGRGWGVSYWSYTTSDLQGVYTPRYYNYMESNFNSVRPDLVSAELLSENSVMLKWNCDTTGIKGFRVYRSVDGSNWNVVLDENNCTTTSAEITYSGSANYYRVSSVKNDSPNFSESNWSNVLGVTSFNSVKKALIVNGFERESGSWRGAGNTFVLKYGKALEESSISFTSIKNSELQNSNFKLDDYDYVFWIIGDESTVDETFNYDEQMLVKEYLEKGGNLFVSGSEIGWDLNYKGSTADKSFYANYLKAKFLSDDASSNSVVGIASTALAGCGFNIGQTYEEDYPDEIGTINGSTLCMKFSNGKGAGIEYAGYFGNSNVQGGLIYLSFPLETTANDEAFNKVIKNTIDYFNSTNVSVNDNELEVIKFELGQNYPNPFNPSTTIKYSIPVDVETLRATSVQLTIYDMLGRKVATLVNKQQQAGNYKVKFNSGEQGLPSGVYFYSIKANDFYAVKKMILLK